VEHGQVVERFFERMQARDWRAAARMLADDVHIDYTATSERFDGPAFIAMNEAYPDGWDLQVVETISQGNRVAAQVVVRHGTARMFSGAPASTPSATARSSEALNTG
jgi:hypothetical protein